MCKYVHQQGREESKGALRGSDLRCERYPGGVWRTHQHVAAIAARSSSLVRLLCVRRRGLSETFVRTSRESNLVPLASDNMTEWVEVGKCTYDCCAAGQKLCRNSSASTCCAVQT